MSNKWSTHKNHFKNSCCIIWVLDAWSWHVRNLILDNMLLCTLQSALSPFPK
jgi:hypothetical protein